MALTERLALLVDMDAKGVIKGLTSIGQTAEKELSKAEGSGARMGKTMSHVGVGMIGVGAVIGGVLFEAAEAAGKAELATIKLENSVRNSSKVTKGATDQFLGLAKAIQNKTAASRIDIIAGEAVLVQFGATNKEVLGLTPLVVDLSRKMGLDLPMANKLVGKALEGSTGALKKAGIIVDETVYKTDRYRAVTEALRRTVGGFAETEGKTFEGQIQRLKNQFTDLEAGVGKGAVEAFTKFLGPVSSVSDAFTNLSPGVQSTVGEVGAYGAAGLIAIGTTATLAGKVLAAKDSFARFGEEMPRTASGIGLVAKAAGALALLSIGGQIAQAIDPGPQPANLNQLAQSLTDFSRTGKLSGEGSRVLGGNFRSLNTSIEQLVAPSNLTKVDKFFSTFTGFVGFKTSTQGATQVVKGLDESLVSLQQTDPKAASAALDAIRTSIGDKNFDRLKPLLRGYNDALAGVAITSKTTAGSQADLAGSVDGVATSADKAVTGTDNAGEAYVRFAGIVKKNIDPVKELSTAIDGLVTSEFGLISATDAFQSGLNALPKDVATATAAGLNLKDTFSSTSDAAITLRGSLITMIDKGAKEIDELVKKGASVDEVTQRVGILSAQFEEVARKAGLPQPVIDFLLKSLQEIPGVYGVNVVVQSNVDEALAAISARLAAAGVKGGPGAYYLPVGAQGPVLPLPPLPTAHHAMGGPIDAPSWVGEKGPEIFVPKGSGWIIPNDALRGSEAQTVPTPTHGGDITFNINVHATPGTNGTKVGQDIVTGLQQYVRVHGGDVQKALGAK